MSLPDWARAWGEPPVTALLRAVPADFFVEEFLGFEPDGVGEHSWLWVEKENLNTADAAQRLARFAHLRERDVSYAGLKDKQALTRQWFSLHLLNREVDWTQWRDPALRILRVERHSRKLRRGAHRGNEFGLLLRNVQGDIAAFAERSALIAVRGVPNYFGEQRFGRDGRNWQAACAWLAKGRPRAARHQTGLHFSSARSYLFNEVLAARVRRGDWCAPLAGEVYVLDGSNSTFMADIDAELLQRIEACDVHLSGPLPGTAAGLAAEAEVAALEAQCLEPYAGVAAALAQAGVEAARRSLRVRPQAWHCEQVGEHEWALRFRLPRGCFATSLVRELARVGPSPNE